MTTTHLVLRYAHISMGMLALASGAASMMLRKGSHPHRKAGNVFFVSMLVMSGTGTIMSIFITPEMGNVLGGSTTFYMVATAWATVIRPAGRIGRFEWLAAFGALAISVFGVTLGIMAANSPAGRFGEYSATFYFIFASVALLAASLDGRMIKRGGFTGISRTTRHLTRMCIAMFMATASFFLGQAKLFPDPVRTSGVLTIPVLLVVGALVYWLVKFKLLPWVRRTRLRPSTTRAREALSPSARQA
jgi:hypothetical protein